MDVAWFPLLQGSCLANISFDSYTNQIGFVSVYIMQSQETTDIQELYLVSRNRQKLKTEIWVWACYQVTALTWFSLGFYEFYQK